MLSRKIFLDASLWTLIISNLSIIAISQFQKWNLSTVLITYWFQSSVIGFFNFVRILSLKEFTTENFTINGATAQATKTTKLFTAFFFAGHYGFFHFIYLIFIAQFFIKSEVEINFINLSLGGIIFFTNHLFSFYYNKKRDEKIKQNIGQLMFKPYLRIVPMHLILMAGAFIGASGLIIFLLLKTFADILMHLTKHQKVIKMELTT